MSVSRLFPCVPARQDLLIADQTSWRDRLWQKQRRAQIDALICRHSIYCHAGKTFRAGKHAVNSSNAMFATSRGSPAAPCQFERGTEREVERLIDSCADNRWPHRDATMILIAFRHGLRASELCDLAVDASGL